MHHVQAEISIDTPRNTSISIVLLTLINFGDNPVIRLQHLEHRL